VQTGVGPQIYQRVFLEVENVGPTIARVSQTIVDGYDPGVFGHVRRQRRFVRLAPGRSS
jgi:hypothetical protein